MRAGRTAIVRRGRLRSGATEAPRRRELRTPPQRRMDAGGSQRTARRAELFAPEPNDLGASRARSSRPVCPGISRAGVPSLAFAAVPCGSIAVAVGEPRLNRREPPRHSGARGRMRATSHCQCWRCDLAPLAPISSTVARTTQPFGLSSARPLRPCGAVRGSRRHRWRRSAVSPAPRRSAVLSPA